MACTLIITLDWQIKESYLWHSSHAYNDGADMRAEGMLGSYLWADVSWVCLFEGNAKPLVEIIETRRGMVDVTCGYVRPFSWE